MKMIIVLLAFLTVSTASAEKVNIDINNSKITWKGGKEFLKDFHTGTVGIKSGYVDIEKGTINGGEIVLDMNKIENTDLTDAAYRNKLVGHLQSADFFDTQKYQTATFKITKATKTSDKTLLEGTLTVKDKTAPLRVNTVINKEGKVYTAKGAADFDRTKFDVKYNSQSFFPDLVKTGKDKVIKNNIDLDFDIKTVATNQ